MNIEVAVRIRPLNSKEVSLGESWKYDTNSIYQFDFDDNRAIGNQFTFGKWHGHSSDVYFLMSI